MFESKRKKLDPCEEQSKKILPVYTLKEEEKATKQKMTHEANQNCCCHAISDVEVVVAAAAAAVVVVVVDGAAGRVHTDADGARGREVRVL